MCVCVCIYVYTYILSKKKSSKCKKKNVGLKDLLSILKASSSFTCDRNCISSLGENDLE